MKITDKIVDKIDKPLSQKRRNIMHRVSTPWWSIIYASILVVLALCGCSSTKNSSFHFESPHSVIIESGVPEAYTEREITRIVKTVVDSWVSQYGRPYDFINLQYLRVRITKDPVSGNYGIAEPWIPAVTVWAHSPHPADSSLVHEMIHVLTFLSDRSGDPNHAGLWWGEGFESPTKRSLKTK